MSGNEVSEEKIKIESLDLRSRRVYVTVKVTSKNPVRDIVSRRDGSAHRVTEVLAGDETGAILLTLWDDDIEKVNDGDTVDIGNGYVTVFQNSMRLNIGRFGTMEPSEATIEDINTENNLSDRHVEDERRSRNFRRFSSDRGYSDRRGGRRDYGRR
jgi:replication factor A1